MTPYLGFQRTPPRYILIEDKERTPVRVAGAPGGTRTPGLLVRSQSLYPPELRARALLPLY
jgi:hypothetical protein